MRLHGWTSIACATALTLSAALSASPAAQATQHSPARQASGTLPGIAAGQHDGARLRLVGRDLTVRLARPLAPSRPRVGVDVTCGDLILRNDPAYTPQAIWGVAASARLRVRGTARRFEVRLDRGVAAQANHCSVRSQITTRAGAEVEAAMRHVHGRGGCRLGAEQRVVARSREVVVAAAAYSGEWESGELLRACPATTGRFVELDDIGTAGGGRGGNRSLALVAATGPHVAWTSVQTPGPSSDFTGGRLIVQTADLSGRPQVRAPWTIALETERSPAVSPFGQLALNSNGVAAWVLRLGTDTLQVRALDGTVRTLDTGVIADLAFTSDGTTLTWSNAGQQRSAPVA